MSLSIRDILILDYFNGKPVHTAVPKYQQDLYGADAEERIRALCEEGWVRHSRPQETVNMLPDKALVHFLTAHGLDGTGAHADLVRRVIRDIPESEYAHAVPKVYVATADGNLEIAHHMAYVLNARCNYGFSEGEIGEAQRTLTAKRASCTASDILKCAFQQKSALFVMAGEWTKLRNLYFRISNFHLRARDNEKALAFLYLVFFLDMSGMENRNTLVKYEKLFPTQKGIIILMNQLRNGLGLTDRGVKSAFLTTIARMAPRLPFSYFSPQVMGDILVERLSGVEFSHVKYLPFRNPPDPAASAYRYLADPRDGGSGTGRRPAAPVRRTAAPPVPPVLRLPSFTAPAPFVPPGAKKEEAAPAAEASRPAEKEEKKSPGLLGKLHHLLKKNGGSR